MFSKIFISAVAAILICSVVAAAMAALISESFAYKYFLRKHEKHSQKNRATVGDRRMDGRLGREIPAHPFEIIVVDDGSGSSNSVSALSVDEVTAGSFLDTNKYIIKVIIDSIKDIRKNMELSSLVRKHFDNTCQTLDFCKILEKCLNRATENTAVIRRIALDCLQEQVENVEAGNGEKNSAMLLDKLKWYTEAADPFKDEFFQAFEQVRIQHVLMLDRLGRQRQELDMKLKLVNSRRKIFSRVFISAVVAILICSVVAAAMAAPPVAAALAAVASVPFGSFGKWFDSLWKGYEKEVKLQLDLVKALKTQTVLVKNDIEKIKVYIDKMKTQIVSLVFTAEFAAEDIKNKLKLCMRTVEDLKEQVDRCNRDTHKARTVVLKKLINPPTGN